MPRDRTNPFEMLEKSHRRLQEGLDELRRASAILARDPRDAQGRGTVVEVSHFLDRSVVRHEKDEEDSLFPRLQGDGDLAPLLAELIEEHRRHEALHTELRDLATACAGELSGAQTQLLGDLARRLDEAYERHVELEEDRVFPAARQTLDEATLLAIAGEMQARRGRG